MNKNDNKLQKFQSGLAAVFIFIIATFIGYFFHGQGYPDTTVVLVYLLAVLIIVWIGKSFALGLIMSVAGTFAFNYFFAEPRFTLQVDDPNYYVTFITMTFTALATSILTTRAQRETQIARQKEMETRAIYMLTNKLSDAQELADIVIIALNSICDGLRCDAGLLCFGEEGEPESTYVYQRYEGEKRQIRRETEDPQKLKFRINQLRSDHDENGEFYDFPLYGRESTLGIIRIPSPDARTMDESSKRLLHSMMDSISLAMDRFYTSRQKMRSIEEVSRERYRANLLRAISHDIRTPLTGIIGTSEMLEDTLKGDEYRGGLATSIRKDAEWLHALVENILNMTRLQDGSMKLKKELVPVEEVIGGAIAHVTEHEPDYDIEVDLPDELIMVPMDPKLIEQAIINLLRNAIKHSRVSDPITIRVEKRERYVAFHIIDSGEGIAEKDLPYIFQSFYTVEKPNITKNKGFGLGLPICETIVTAHQGSISASNRKDGRGAILTFTLPLEEIDE